MSGVSSVTLDTVSSRLLQQYPQLDNPRMRVRLKQSTPGGRRRILENAVNTRKRLGMDQTTGDIVVRYVHVVDIFTGLALAYER